MAQRTSSRASKGKEKRKKLANEKEKDKTQESNLLTNKRSKIQAKNKQKSQ